ncbi:MAG: hypothetical protein ACI4KF_11990 [Huintestinicola sp.]
MGFAFMGIGVLALLLIVLVLLIEIAFFGAGYALFFYGCKHRRNPDNDHKKWPTVMKAAGIIIMVYMIISIALYVVGLAHRISEVSSLQSLKDNSENISKILELADSNDREGLEAMFSEGYRGTTAFENALDEFLYNYPHGLSACELEKINSESYTCQLDGEKYYITIWRDAEGTDVGHFVIKNEEAHSDPLPRYDNTHIYCDIIPKPDTHRMIEGENMGYMFSPERTLTEQDFRDILTDETNITDIIEGFGEPNAIKRESDMRKILYYSIESEETERPRYACVGYITGGQVYCCYICSEYGRNHEDIWTIDFNSIE